MNGEYFRKCKNGKYISIGDEDQHYDYNRTHNELKKKEKKLGLYPNQPGYYENLKKLTDEERVNEIVQLREKIKNMNTKDTKNVWVEDGTHYDGTPKYVQYPKKKLEREDKNHETVLDLWKKQLRCIRAKKLL